MRGRKARIGLGTLAPLVAALLVVGAAPGSAGAGQYVLPPVPADIQAVLAGDVSDRQWALEVVNAPAAWSASTGAGTTVAVIDTGVDASHPDLAGQVVPGAIVRSNPTTGRRELVPATIEETSDDWYGHGSHVAGIIAAKDDGVGVTGIAPDAMIMPIDLLPRGRDGSVGWITFLRLVEDSLRFAVANGADVANLSLGLPSSHLGSEPDADRYRTALTRLCSAVHEVSSAGLVVVASAGNDGSWSNVQLAPASCSDTVSVAALAPSLARTFWSSYDETVDLTAPGDTILSVASSAGENLLTPHMNASGTSMSSPAVAAVAALVRAAHPGWSSEQVRDALTATAHDLGPSGRDAEYGHGLVDAAAALGVAAPPATASNGFAVWVDTPWFGSGRDLNEVVVSWTVPARDPVDQWTVTRSAAEGSTSEVLGGRAVRLETEVAHGDWFTVTADIAGDELSSYPIPVLTWRGIFEASAPAPVSQVRAERGDDRMVVTWQPPEDTSRTDVIVVEVRYDNGARTRVEHEVTSRYPTRKVVTLPRSARWRDAQVRVLAAAAIDEAGWGTNLLGRWRKAPGVFAATHALHVTEVLGAGRRAAEVHGGISARNAQRLCGNTTCHGTRLDVVARSGKVTDRVVARLNVRGEFHATVATKRGAEKVEIRLLGPRKTTSGGFRSFPIARGGR